MATRMYDGNQDEQLIQEFTGHHSNCVRRYKHASDRIKHKASHIIQGAKRCIASKLSQKKDKKKAEVIKTSKSKVESNSDAEFMSSQSLCTFQGKPIENGPKEAKCCKHGNKVNSNGSAICKFLSEIMKNKYKKISISIEIVNDSD